MLLRQLFNSLARVRRDDEVNIGHVFDRVLQDGVDGNPVLCRQLAHSLDDPEVVPARRKKEKQQSTKFAQFYSIILARHAKSRPASKNKQRKNYCNNREPWRQGYYSLRTQ